MLNSVPTQLEQAKEHFYAWRMWEAYQILRRFYDRLPFQQTPDHAEYIGMFVRTIMELGKDFELKFYRGELEKIFDRNPDPNIGYPLAVVIRDSEPRNFKRAAQIIQGMLARGVSGPMEARCKMVLAYCLDAVNKDVAGFRAIIDSIKYQDDPTLSAMTELWRGKGFRDSGDFKQAELIFRNVQALPICKVDWYLWFTAKILFAGLHLSQGDIESAVAIHAELTQFLKDKSFKTSKMQLAGLAEEIEAKRVGPPLIVTFGGDDVELSYLGKKMSLTRSNSHERILTELIRDKTLKKTRAGELVNRGKSKEVFSGEAVYQAIHAVRGLIEELGLPRETIKSSGDNYIFVKNTRFVEG